MPEVAVVVINYNTPELTEACLDSLPAGLAGLDAEVVVVENGSADDSLARLSARDDCRVEHVEVNRGFGHGANRGVAATSAPYVIVMNSDTEARPGSLAALVAALRGDAAIGLAAPALENVDGSDQASAYRRFPTALTCALEAAILPGYLGALIPALPHPTAVSPAEVRAGAPYLWVTSAVFAVSRAWWDRIGPLDEDYYLYFEDTDWQRRLVRTGGRVEIVQAARVQHLQRAGDPVAAVVPAPWVDSAVRFLGLDGASPARVRGLLRVALAVAWATTWTTALRPGGAPKAVEMRRRLARARARTAAPR